MVACVTGYFSATRIVTGSQAHSSTLPISYARRFLHSIGMPTRAGEFHRRITSLHYTDQALPRSFSGVRVRTLLARDRPMSVGHPHRVRTAVGAGEDIKSGCTVRARTLDGPVYHDSFH